MVIQDILVLTVQNKCEDYSLIDIIAVGSSLHDLESSADSPLNRFHHSAGEFPVILERPRNLETRLVCCDHQILISADENLEYQFGPLKTGVLVKGLAVPGIRCHRCQVCHTILGFSKHEVR